MEITRYSVYFMAYLLIAFTGTFIIVKQENPKNYLLNFVIAYWLILTTTFKTRYAWSLLPYYHRLKVADPWLSWILIFYVIAVFLSRKGIDKRQSEPMPNYEKMLLLYLGAAILFYIIHGYYLSDVQVHKVMYFGQIYLSALFIYIGIRNILDKELLNILIKMSLFMVVFSSIVGIIHFFGDKDILRFGPRHLAIPGFARSSGIFRQPYDNGIFAIMGIFLGYYFIKNRFLKVTALTLFGINLILTFSRGLWLAFIFVSLYHFAYFYKNKFKKFMINSGILTLFVSVSYGTYIVNSSIFQSRAFTDRIFQDTVTIRFGYYFKIIETIPDRWLIGQGDVENNPVYFDKMADLEQSFMWALGKMGGIHNLILEELFLRGIPLTLVFLLYFYFFIRFCSKESFTKNNYFYLIPGYFLMSYFIYFMSVSGFLTSTSGFLCVVYTALVSGVYHNKIDISEYSYPLNDSYIANNTNLKDQL